MTNDIAAPVPVAADGPLGDLTNVPDLVLRSLLDTANLYVAAPNTLDYAAAVLLQCRLLAELGRRGLSV